MTKKEKEIQELMKNPDFQKKFSKLVGEFSDEDDEDDDKIYFTVVREYICHQSLFADEDEEGCNVFIPTKTELLKDSCPKNIRDEYFNNDDAMNLNDLLVDQDEKSLLEDCDIFLYGDNREVIVLRAEYRLSYSKDDCEFDLESTEFEKYDGVLDLGNSVANFKKGKQLIKL